MIEAVERGGTTARARLGGGMTLSIGDPCRRSSSSIITASRGAWVMLYACTAQAERVVGEGDGEADLWRVC